MRSGNGEASIDDLVEFLQDPDLVVRVQAGFALGELGEEALPAVPMLVEMLRCGDVQDCKLAAIVLRQIGPSASEAVPALLQIANDDDDETVVEAVLSALEKIDLADTDEESLSEAA